MIQSGDEPLEGAMPEIGSPPSETPHRLLFRLVIPVEKHFSKKNAKTIRYRWKGGQRGSPFLGATNEAAMAERVLVSHMQAGERFSSVSHPISLPMLAVFKFKFTDFYTVKGEINRRAMDLTNVIQGVEDALQKSEVILDDALITKIIANKEFGLENEIVVELFTDESAASKPKSKERKKPSPRKR